MPRPPTDVLRTRRSLHEAARDLVAAEGPGASVRSITRAAGVTEGTLYRHYASRELLLSAVFTELVEPMIAEKAALVAMRAPLRDRLREWIRCTYTRFDKDPSGFAYVFLTDHSLPRAQARLAHRQSELFGELFAAGVSAGELRPVATDIATAIFVGQLLTVPTMIRRGGLRKPAEQYTDEIAEAVWRALGAGSH